MLVRFSGNPNEPPDETPITLVIDNLPFGAEEVAVEHYRIDASHGNAHGEWVAQGSPDRPTAEQAAVIRAKESLEPLEPTAVERIVGGQVAKELTLPRCSVSLIVLRPRR